jgi:hypothetical protein
MVPNVKKRTIFSVIIDEKGNIDYYFEKRTIQSPHIYTLHGIICAVERDIRKTIDGDNFVNEDKY